MKRWRRFLWILLGCGFAAAIAVLAVGRDNGPRVRGRSLKGWVDRYFAAYNMNEDSPEAREAADAIREIGTNAIPYLLKWVVHENPAWGRKGLNSLGQLVRPVNRAVSDRMLFGPRFSEGPSRQAWSAILAFGILGGEARTAVPELARLLNDPRQRSINAAIALGKIGLDGLPPLLSLVANSTGSRRAMAILEIGQMGTNARSAAPMLTPYLCSSNRFESYAATNALRKLAPEMLGETNVQTRTEN